MRVTKPPRPRTQDAPPCHGASVKTTQPFRYAEALLGWLTGASALDAFADPVRIAVLNALAPTQRQKLAKQLRIEFSKSGETVNETAIAEQIKQTPRSSWSSRADRPRT